MNIRNLILAIAGTFISLFSIAQKSHLPKGDNLLFLLRQQEHIAQAIKTVEQLQATPKSSSVKIHKAVIIVCGEAVKEFVTGQNNELIEKARKTGVTTIYVCGLSLTKFNLSQKDLLPGVEYVPNGLIKAFEIQKTGYLSVEL